MIENRRLHPHPLRQITLLKTLEEADLRELAEGGDRQQRYGRDEQIALPDDTLSTILAVVQGDARVYRCSAEGAISTIEILHQGGIWPLITHPHPRNQIMARTRGATVWHLRRAAFTRLLPEPTPLSRLLDAAITGRMHRMHDRIESLSVHDVTTRVAHELARLAAMDGLVIAATHEELASLVGAAREQVGAALKTLRRHALISSER